MNKTSNWFRSLRTSVKERFDLTADSATQQEVVENITRSVEFRGTNLWILIFATFVASLGLNVNSNPVIIGAMLISPLMGPIMGCGLALGINDFALMKKSLRNLGIMTGIAIVTATLYFVLSPISTAQSELLARTTPTMYDVMIALFGGAAGVVAQTRRDRTSTVIPGVAIATALMPPLCTAGFGLATMQYKYFLGAAYLFFINMVCIALATYAVVRFLRYKRYELADPKAERRVKVYMLVIMIVTLVPSSIIGVRLIRESVFEANAQKYISTVFRYNETRVLESKTEFHSGSRVPSTIEVILYGEPISQEMIDNAEAQMPDYDLKNVQLLVRQSGTNDTSIDFTSVQKGYSELLSEKNRRIQELNKALDGYRALDTLSMSELTKECNAVVGNIERVSMSRQVVYAADGQSVDTVFVCIVKPTEEFKSGDRERLERWLRVRGKTDKIQLYVE